ncbi:MAG: MlaD family protein [Paracoccus sp. (in: a-proteobacteria)]|nr:MlaD family protein [Paracoccus sp. (in: a-proteobacteria)]
METRANHVLIGAFVVLGFLAMLGFLLWFANYRADRQFDYYDVYFSEVSGLGLASEVRFAGLPVGQVVDMQIAPGQSGGAVRVRLELNADTPVRSDSVASVESLGITGLSIVGITAGSPGAALLTSDDGTIPEIRAGQSILQSLGTQGPEIIDRLNLATERLAELLGPDNQQRVQNILGNVERSTGNLDQAIADVTSATQSIARVAGEISGFGEQIGGLSDAARTTLGNADRTLASADEALQSARVTFERLDGYIAGDLTAATGSVRDSTDEIGALARRAGTTLDGIDTAMVAVDEALQTGQGALSAAQSAFEGADRAINEDLGPVISDLRESLSRINTVTETLASDLPAIMTRIRGAADAAQASFTTLGRVVNAASVPVTRFASDGLPQISTAARDLSSMARSADELARAMRRLLR